jgi:hypothetical protein
VGSVGLIRLERLLWQRNADWIYNDQRSGPSPIVTSAESDE